VTQSCRARQDAAAAIPGTETSSLTISASGSRNKTEPSDSGFHHLALLKSTETGMTA
jgi:hypothetical protein